MIRAYFDESAEEKVGEGFLAVAGYVFSGTGLNGLESKWKARSFHVASTRRYDVEPIVKANIHPDTFVMTDEGTQYQKLHTMFANHDTVNHSKDEYARGIVSTNSVEGFYSIFKRGMKGIYQHCSEKHLHRYLAEFDFRYSNRVGLGVNNEGRTSRMIAGIVGKRLTYQQPAK